MAEAKILSGIVVSPKGISVHPEFWNELEKAPPEVRKEVLTVLKTLKAAQKNCCEKYGSDFDVEQFNQEVELISGQVPEKFDIDAEDDNVIEQLKKFEQPFTKN